MTWKLEARRPKIVADPKGTKRTRLSGCEVREVITRHCEVIEGGGGIVIRPDPEFIEKLRAPLLAKLREAENTAAIANDVLAGVADARRSAFWSGCFWGAIGFGVLAAAILAARGVIGG